MRMPILGAVPVGLTASASGVPSSTMDRHSHLPPTVVLPHRAVALLCHCGLSLPPHYAAMSSSSHSAVPPRAWSSSPPRHGELDLPLRCVAMSSASLPSTSP
jgi:hypothetical protein